MNHHLFTFAEYWKHTDLPIDSDECDYTLEIDHIFICVPEKKHVSVLQQLGLFSPNWIVQRVEHGTSAILVIFENVYLEFIWVEDPFIAAQSSLQSGIDILSRAHWQQTKASPFGIGLRSKAVPSNLQLNATKLFPQKDNFCSDRFVEDVPVYFSAENLAHQEEPLCFLVPNHITITHLLNLASDAHRYFVSHPIGIKKLTDVKVTIGSDKPISHVNLILSQAMIETKIAASPLVELTFDEGNQGRVLDARPLLPLLLKY